MISYRNILHRSLAGFMAFWLSGVVFLFCCPEMATAAEPDSCPLMKMSSHCDKASQQTASDSFEGVRPACFECCAFLPIVFDKSRKIDIVQKQISAPAETTPLTKFRFPVARFVLAVHGSLPSRVPDRHGTYLVNRAFRI
jgi:hypothetical protein